MLKNGDTCKVILLHAMSNCERRIATNTKPMLTWVASETVEFNVVSNNFCLFMRYNYYHLGVFLIIWLF